MGKVLHMITIVITGLGLLSCISSTVSDKWLVEESSGEEHFSGLWYACNTFLGTTTCSDINLDLLGKERSDKYKAIRGLAISAILAYGLASFCHLFTFMRDTHGKVFLLWISAAGIFQFITIALYTDLYRSLDLDVERAKFGWSYDLGWTGAGLALISFWFCIAMHCSSND